ncbi:glycosyltransferase family 1 protein [Paracoccus yeei]|uniref:glycosyltransferase family 4 protein n=1 Tax=Paracoccus yeei TaxID=147645 RepID=UPI00242ACEDB|nr:glycosyltransferase family 1 protein [Paracoccus yeei]
MPADPAILLDISRLLSRLGRGTATGIDRVEAEWLAHLQTRDHLLLCRVPRGQLLLPPPAGAALLRWLAGDLADLPRPGPWHRLLGRDTLRLRAVRGLRRMALRRYGRAPRGLGADVARRLGADAAYLNLGHANWDRRVMAALAPLPRAVMVHDTIPLDHPEYTRQGQSALFRDRFAAVLAGADLVLTVSQASAQSVRDWQGRLRQRRALPVVAAPIGTRLAAPDPAGLPPGLDLSRPFFVTLGTIEPRKNHALLLDAWQELSRRLDPPRLPQLFIVGSRGWENAETFARLDALPPGGPVRELNGLDDGAVAELLGRSHGLLMPSRAEGFGLPLTEAAARGIPVISAPLPVARELLGGYARYLPPDDARAWAGAVALLAAALPLRLPPHPVPQWDGHFAQVAAAIRERLPAGAAGAMPR